MSLCNDRAGLAEVRLLRCGRATSRNLFQDYALAHSAPEPVFRLPSDIYASVTDGENNHKHDRDNSRHKAEHPERWNGRAIHNWNLPDTVYLNPDKIRGQEEAAFFFRK